MKSFSKSLRSFTAITALIFSSIGFCFSPDASAYGTTIDPVPPKPGDTNDIDIFLTNRQVRKLYAEMPKLGKEIDEIVASYSAIVRQIMKSGFTIISYTSTNMKNGNRDLVKRFKNTQENLRSAGYLTYEESSALAHDLRKEINHFPLRPYLVPETISKNGLSFNRLTKKHVPFLERYVDECKNYKKLLRRIFTAPTSIEVIAQHDLFKPDDQSPDPILLQRAEIVASAPGLYVERVDLLIGSIDNFIQAISHYGTFIATHTIRKKVGEIELERNHSDYGSAEEHDEWEKKRFAKTTPHDKKIISILDKQAAKIREKSLLTYPEFMVETRMLGRELRFSNLTPVHPLPIPTKNVFYEALTLRQLAALKKQRVLFKTIRKQLNEIASMEGNVEELISSGIISTSRFPETESLTNEKTKYSPRGLEYWRILNISEKERREIVALARRSNETVRHWRAQMKRYGKAYLYRAKKNRRPYPLGIRHVSLGKYSRRPLPTHIALENIEYLSGVIPGFPSLSRMKTSFEYMDGRRGYFVIARRTEENLKSINDFILAYSQYKFESPDLTQR
ncbi:hypothetical protein OAF27_00930 [Verrucomicrobiales bacterium]|nr:hypothetical protein [Verrucomicrobiales bacterium]